MFRALIERTYYVILDYFVDILALDIQLYNKNKTDFVINKHKIIRSWHTSTLINISKFFFYLDLNL